MIVHSFDPVVLVGGADIEPEDINIFQSENLIFVGVDSGADHLRKAGQTPSAVIGDLDSLSHESRRAFGNLLYQVDEQDTVDFEKAVTRVDAPLIYAIGFSGGRLDHMMAVLDVMGRHPDRKIILVGPKDAAAVISAAGLELESVGVGTPISILPLAVSHMRATGLRWPIDGREMAPLGFSSASNEASEDTVRIFADGVVLVVVPLTHLKQLTKAVMG